MQTLTRSLLAAAAVAVFTLVGTLGCTEAKPDRLTLDPNGPYRFERKGQTETVKVAAFTGKSPYVNVVPATWKSSDESVATVDDKGTVTATGSGKAQIIASAWGLSVSADVDSVIVGSVSVDDDLPKPFRLNNKGVQLHVTVKDDKGNVIKDPVIAYHADNYCVEVSDEGFVKPLSDGDCNIEVRCASKLAKLAVSVK